MKAKMMEEMTVKTKTPMMGLDASEDAHRAGIADVTSIVIIDPHHYSVSIQHHNTCFER